MRSGAGSWPGSSRSRVVKGGRIPLPWAMSGYDLSMGRWRCTISPGKEGSRAGTGDSIVLGCGHTWGYTAYWDSWDSGWGPSPRHYARNAWKGPSEGGSGPAPKPMSRALPVRQIASTTGLSSSRDPSPGLGRGPRDPLVTTVSGGTSDQPPTPPKATPSQCLPDLQTRLAGEMDARTGAASGWSVWTWGDLVVVNLRPETGPPPKRLSAREERAALWAALGLPSHKRR